MGLVEGRIWCGVDFCCTEFGCRECTDGEIRGKILEESDKTRLVRSSRVESSEEIMEGLR